MPRAASVNLTIEQGATFQRNFRWRVKGGLGIDITGLRARMQVRSSVSSPVVLLELTTENGGIVITEAPEGRYRLYLGATETETLTFSNGKYDLEFYDPLNDDVVYRLMRGSVKVSSEYTKED
jgi:hypothetical protein